VAGVERIIAMAGSCGIPANAVAVSVSVAATQPTTGGDVRLYPAGSPLPLSSTINYSARQTRSNNALIALGTPGAVAAQNLPGGTTHLIVDVNGYFAEHTTACTDVDGDGWSVCDNDCDDANAAVNPGAFDVPRNGLDDDCNGVMDDPPEVCDGNLVAT